MSFESLSYLKEDRNVHIDITEIDSSQHNFYTTQADEWRLSLPD